jgi:nucleoside-diphosphate-sugar epimerase
MTSAKTSFQRPRLLIVGCGDVGMRLLPLVRDRYRVFAVTSNPGRCAELRAAGAVPIVADLDVPHTLARLSRLARLVVHMAPPKGEGACDTRTRHLAHALAPGTRLVYLSTSGVYGDCQGALVDETRTVAPHNPRARRRVDAERTLRAWGKTSGSSVAIIRVPGIYAADRLPFKRLADRAPALNEQDDVFTNHIHADDLARIVALALVRARPGRVYHAVDDTRMKMAEYFDVVADAFGMARVPRLARLALAAVASPVTMSFMSESRRLDNERIKGELGVRLRYPDVTQAVQAMAAQAPPPVSAQAATASWAATDVAAGRAAPQ